MWIFRVFLKVLFLIIWKSILLRILHLGRGGLLRLMILSFRPSVHISERSRKFLILINFVSIRQVLLFCGLYFMLLFRSIFYMSLHRLT